MPPVRYRPEDTSEHMALPLPRSPPDSLLVPVVSLPPMASPLPVASSVALASSTLRDLQHLRLQAVSPSPQEDSTLHYHHVIPQVLLPLMQVAGYYVERSRHRMSRDGRMGVSWFLLPPREIKFW